MPTPFDHVLVALFAVAWPLYSIFYEVPRLKRRLAAGIPGELIRGYRQTLVVQWSFAAAALTLWWRSGRPWSALGMSAPIGLGFWVGVVLAALWIGFLYLQYAAARDNARVRARIGEIIRPVAFILPRTPRELGLFKALSITAGICEELLFRGFLFWYVGSFTNIAVAAAISTLIFGLAHAYQGRNGAMKAGLAGLGMAGLYLLTRSLWVPIVAHAATDIFGGLTAHEALREERPPRPPDGGARSAHEGDAGDRAPVALAQLEHVDARG